MRTHIAKLEENIDNLKTVDVKNLWDSIKML